MFRSLILLVIAGTMTGCAQQASTPELAQAVEINTPATLAHAEAPEGWVVRNDPEASTVVVENGQQITELAPVEMVFVQGDRLAMEASLAAPSANGL